MSGRRVYDDACGLPVVVPLTLLLMASACAEGAEGNPEQFSTAGEPVVVAPEAIHQVGTSELLSQVRDVERPFPSRACPAKSTNVSYS